MYRAGFGGRNLPVVSSVWESHNLIQKYQNSQVSRGPAKLSENINIHWAAEGNPLFSLHPHVIPETLGQKEEKNDAADAAV